MKLLLAAMFIALLVVGCGEVQEEAIDWDDNETRDKIIAEAIDLGKLQERGKEGEKLAYAPNQETPYSGWMKWMYDNGQIEGLSQLKDGKSDGLAMGWNQNGQKSWEQTYKDGKEEGLATEWYSNGQKESELTFKNGKIVKAVAWKPNGTKCPGTNVVDGNGVRVHYYEYGPRLIRGDPVGRTTYKDGMPSKD